MTLGRVIMGLTPFLRLRKRSHEYAQGYRAATKACVTWLENEAENRGKKAQPILHKAASEMAREAKMIAWDCEPEDDEGPMYAALLEMRKGME